MMNYKNLFPLSVDRMKKVSKYKDIDVEGDVVGTVEIAKQFF